MRSVIRAVTFDCADPYALAEFWAGALGAVIAPGSRPGDARVCVDTPDGQPKLTFQRVPESKMVKNRLHLDLSPVEDDRGQGDQPAHPIGRHFRGRHPHTRRRGDRGARRP